MDEEILKDEGILDDDEKKPTCRLDSHDNNVVNIIGLVAGTLRDAEQGGKASEFAERASRCVNYDEVLRLASEYVKIT